MMKHSIIFKTNIFLFQLQHSSIFDAKCSSELEKLIHSGYIHQHWAPSQWIKHLDKLLYASQNLTRKRILGCLHHHYVIVLPIMQNYCLQRLTSKRKRALHQHQVLYLYSIPYATRYLTRLVFYDVWCCIVL